MKKYMIAGLLLATTSTAAFAQDTKHFDGGYLGGEIGYQDSGDGLNGVYYGATAGFRKQTDGGLVYGLEGNLGKADVDIAGINNIIDTQWSALGTVGWVFGNENRDMFSLGAGYVNIKVSALGQSETGDGIASFAGYERAIGDNFSFRLRVTSYDAFETVIGTAGFGFRF